MASISPESSLKLDSRHRATALMVGVQVLFVGVLCILSLGRLLHFERAADNQTVTTLWTAVLFLTIGSFVLRRIFNGWERLTNAALLGGVDGLLSRLRANALMTCGFGTVAACVGFVIAQMTMEYTDMLRAAAVSFVVFFANFPRKKVWRTVVEKTEQP